jgi:hypothetical protein
MALKKVFRVLYSFPNDANRSFRDEKDFPTEIIDRALGPYSFVSGSGWKKGVYKNSYDIPEAGRLDVAGYGGGCSQIEPFTFGSLIFTHSFV